MMLHESVAFKTEWLQLAVHVGIMMASTRLRFNTDCGGSSSRRMSGKCDPLKECSGRQYSDASGQHPPLENPKILRTDHDRCVGIQ
eukprot:g49011.t1